jgi:alkyl sulfatase BDS1-like metallo-beta-lactamase superfamily hydrolase
MNVNKDIGRSNMSDALVKVLRRFEDRLARLESEVEAGAKHWKAVHLHKALAALPGDHVAADLHLDELDRVELTREYPEMAAAHAPTVDEIRSRFAMIAGGML